MIVCQWLVKSQWFSLGTPVSSTKNADCHDRTEILLKVALNTITKANTWDLEETRCVGTTRMSPPWILRRLANVSPFFNSLSNRLRITNYCLKSVSSSLLNNISWTNLDMIRNLQHLHMNKKSYTYKTLPFNSH